MAITSSSYRLVAKINFSDAVQGAMKIKSSLHCPNIRI